MFDYFGIQEFLDGHEVNYFIYDDQFNLQGVYSQFNEDVDLDGDDFPKFTIGDIVEVLDSQIRVGIVAALPLNKKEVAYYRKKSRGDFSYTQEDNVYLVVFESKKTYGDHSHPGPAQIKRVMVSAKQEARLKKLLKEESKDVRSAKS